MSRFTKRWLLISFLVIFSSIVIDITLALSVFEKHYSFLSTFIYMSGIFIALPPGAMLTWVVIEYSNPKIPALASLLFYTLLSFFAVFQTSYFFENLFIFGILNGLAIISFTLPSRSIINFNIEDKSHTMFHSLNNSFYSIANLSAPILITSSFLLIDSFIIPLFLSLLFIFIAIFFLIITKIEIPQRKIHLEVFLQFRNNKIEKLNALILNIINGFRAAIFWAFSSPIILGVVGNVTYWGLIQFFLNVINFIINKFYLSKMKKIHQIESNLILGGFIFAVITLVLVVNMNIYTFIFFLFLNSIFASISFIGLSKIVYLTVKIDHKFEEKTAEYATFDEIGIGIGRLLSFFLIGPAFISIKDANHNLLLITLIFLIVSTIPIAIFKVLIRSKFFVKTIDQYQHNIITQEH